MERDSFDELATEPPANDPESAPVQGVAASASAPFARLLIRAPEGASASKDLLRLGVIDDVIEEPVGAAHRDHHQMAARLKMYLMKSVRELSAKPLDELVNNRYEKFRRMGVFLEGPVVEAAASQG